MPALLIRHKVTDYATWKAAFDDHGANRRANGSQGGRLFRNAADPGETLVLLAWDDLERARLARGYFERAGVAGRIHIHVEDALQALGATPGVFDMIFNDVDKEGYPDVLDAVPSRIKPGGLFVTDNTIWHARVLDPKKDADRGVAVFNQRLSRSKDFRITSVLPLRDGVTVAVRA